MPVLYVLRKSISPIPVVVNMRADIYSIAVSDINLCLMLNKLELLTS